MRPDLLLSIVDIFTPMNRKDFTSILIVSEFHRFCLLSDVAVDNSDNQRRV